MGTKQNAALLGRRIFSSKLLFLLDIFVVAGARFELATFGL
jgi:hypothetical protein